MAIIQSKVVEWIIILAALAVAIIFMMALLPALWGPNFFQNPGVIR